MALPLRDEDVRRRDMRSRPVLLSCSRDSMTRHPVACHAPSRSAKLPADRSKARAAAVSKRPQRALADLDDAIADAAGAGHGRLIAVDDERQVRAVEVAGSARRTARIGADRQRPLADLDDRRIAQRIGKARVAGGPHRAGRDGLVVEPHRPGARREHHGGLIVERLDGAGRGRQRDEEAGTAAHRCEPLIPRVHRQARSCRRLAIVGPMSASGEPRELRSLVPFEVAAFLALAIAPLPEVMPIALPLVVVATASRWARRRSWDELLHAPRGAAAVGIVAGFAALAIAVVAGTPFVELMSGRAVE